MFSEKFCHTEGASMGGRFLRACLLLVILAALLSLVPWPARKAFVWLQVGVDFFLIKLIADILIPPEQPRFTEDAFWEWLEFFIIAVIAGAAYLTLPDPKPPLSPAWPAALAYLVIRKE